MALRKWLRRLWLEAQGVPWGDIFGGTWKANTFIANPPSCVICGRAWRPDKPRYVALFGKATHFPHGGIKWISPEYGIMAKTGQGQDSVRYACTEHWGEYLVLRDCVTNELVWMTRSPSRPQHLWQDICYWSGSGVRFVWLLGRWAWLWTAYKAVGYKTDHVRGPWPPLRVG